MATPSLDTRTYDGGLSRLDVVRWRNALFVVFALSGFAISTWLGRVPSIRDILHASTLEMGLLAGGISIGGIAGVVGSSHVIAALGAKRSATVSLLVVAGGLVLAGLSAALGAGFWAILVSMAVVGFGNGTLDVSMNISAAACERVLGKTVMPLFHASFSLGTMVGALLGALAERAAVSVGFHVTIVAILVAVGGTFFVRRFQSEELGHSVVAEAADAAAPSSTSGWRSRLAIWTTPGTILIGLIVLGMATAEGSANDWLALAMVDGHDVSNAGGSTILFVFLTAMTIARVAGSPMIDRYGRVPMLRASTVSAVVGLGLVILSPVLWLAIVGVVLWGFGAALGFPVGLSAAADDSRNAAARVSAVATIGYAAFLVLPPVMGFLGEHVGLLHAFTVILVLIVVAGFASGAAREPSRRSAAPGR